MYIDYLITRKDYNAADWVAGEIDSQNGLCRENAWDYLKAAKYWNLELIKKSGIAAECDNVEHVRTAAGEYNKWARAQNMKMRSDNALEEMVNRHAFTSPFGMYLIDVCKTLEAYCEMNGLFPRCVDNRTVSMKLKQLGFTPMRKKTGLFFPNLGFNPISKLELE